MSSGTLTPQQVAFFRTFGYLAMPGLLADCIGEITQAFTEVFERHQRQHDGSARTAILPFLDSHERLCALLDDPRIDGIAASLLGDDYNYLGSDGNYYVGDTQWHCDWWSEDMTFIKIAFYLDPVRRDTGALRVVPGSNAASPYRAALGDRIVDCRQTLGITGAEVPAVALECDPGDVVCFDLNTLHASFGGSNRRRMFTINACQRHPEDKLAGLRKLMSVLGSKHSDGYYGKVLVDTATPQRQRHMEQVLANVSAVR